MHHSAALSLLFALPLVLPSATMAQGNIRTDTDTAAQAASAALPQAAASAASAAETGLGSSDDKAFGQAADAERQRIAEGRAAANVRYGQDRRACWQRFAVNACMDRALERSRATLDALRHDELVLNAQQRERRTAARLDEIARKQSKGAREEQDHNAKMTSSPASSAQ